MKKTFATVSLIVFLVSTLGGQGVFAATSTASTTIPVVNLATTTITTKIVSTTTTAVMMSGKASWYSNQGGFYAASPDFKVGTKLRVYLVNSSKYVDVVVNDWGPDRVKHPDRVVDLDREAFLALADLGQGIINVRLELLPKDAEVITQPTSVVSSNSQAVSKPVIKDSLKLTSKSAIVVSAKTGKVLYSKSQNLQLPLASLTKLVAAKVFLNTKTSLNKVVAYKKQDQEYNTQYAGLGEVARLHVKEGETMTVTNYLYAALLGSANNSVETLVRASGLKRSTFIARMNRYAKSIGATKTHFVEPTGLSPENVSSVADYALISRKVLAEPIIEKITKSHSYTFKTINTKQKHLINNTNKLVTGGTLSVTGSKTGYLEEAEYCLMTRAKDSKGRQVIAVTFGTPDRSASFSETKKLIQYGFSQLN